jgi:hypothetical protein
MESVAQNLDLCSLTRPIKMFLLRPVELAATTARIENSGEYQILKLDWLDDSGERDWFDEEAAFGLAGWAFTIGLANLVWWKSYWG